MKNEEKLMDETKEWPGLTPEVLSFDEIKKSIVAHADSSGSMCTVGDMFLTLTC